MLSRFFFLHLSKSCACSKRAKNLGVCAKTPAKICPAALDIPHGLMGLLASKVNKMDDTDT